MLKICSFLAQHLFNSKKNCSISLSPFHNLKRREKQSFRLKSSQSKSRSVLAATCCEKGGIGLLKGKWACNELLHTYIVQPTIVIVSALALPPARRCRRRSGAAVFWPARILFALVIGLLGLMRRALMGLNLYGGEAVRHKLKNRQKMHFLCF